MGTLRRIWEAVRGGGGASVVSASQVATGSAPEVKFPELVDIYLGDPTARAAVDFLADQAVGVGFYTTAEDPRAKDAVDSFCEAVDLDGMLQIGAREIIGYGNSFWEVKPSPRLEELNILPITSIDKITRDKAGKPLKLRQTSTYGAGELDMAKIIHFIYNPVDREAFGCGLLRSVAESLVVGTGDTREALYKMKGKMQSSMIQQFEKFSAPNELWMMKGLSDPKLEAFAAKLKTMPKAGARWASNVDSDVKTSALPRVTEFSSYVENVMNEFYVGLQTPLPKLFTTPGFTEASAKAALELHAQRVRGIQRYIKRVVEGRIFAPVVAQAGMDSAKAKVRLNWGSPEVPSVNMADVLMAAQLGIVREEEFRKMAAGMGWQLWAPEQGAAATERAGARKWKDYPDLERLLRSVVERAKAGKLSREQAVAEGYRIIGEYAALEDQRALIWVRDSLGMPDLRELPPETRSKLDDSRRKRLDSFSRILNDALAGPA